VGPEEAGPAGPELDAPGLWPSDRISR